MKQKPPSPPFSVSKIEINESFDVGIFKKSGKDFQNWGKTEKNIKVSGVQLLITGSPISTGFSVAELYYDVFLEKVEQMTDEEKRTEFEKRNNKRKEKKSFLELVSFRRWVPN